MRYKSKDKLYEYQHIKRKMIKGSYKDYDYE